MCFFDQHRFSCGDWKWGRFRQHCNREYRTGETCGMKLVMQTYGIPQKCKTCEKIETKRRRRAQEQDRLHRWAREGNRYVASIARAQQTIACLEVDICGLEVERERENGGFCALSVQSFPVGAMRANPLNAPSWRLQNSLNDNLDDPDNRNYPPIEFQTSGHSTYSPGKRFSRNYKSGSAENSLFLRTDARTLRANDDGGELNVFTRLRIADSVKTEEQTSTTPAVPSELGYENSKFESLECTQEISALSGPSLPSNCAIDGSENDMDTASDSSLSNWLDSPEISLLDQDSSPSRFAVQKRAQQALLEAFDNNISPFKSCTGHASHSSSTDHVISDCRGLTNWVGSDRNGKRKANSDDDRSSEEDSNSRKRRQITSPFSQTSDSRLLACPFYKHNRRYYRKCSTSILKEISRVKQHLDRNHRIPVHCASCFQVFESEAKRDDHTRQRICDVLPRKKFEGIDEYQRRQLKKRSSPQKSREENWYLIYDILFPNALIRPESPYLEEVLSAELLAFHEFCCLEGPGILRLVVSSELPEELQHHEDELHRIFQTAFRDCLQVILERWEARDQTGQFNATSAYQRPVIMPTPTTLETSTTENQGNMCAETTREPNDPPLHLCMSDIVGIGSSVPLGDGRPAQDNEDFALPTGIQADRSAIDVSGNLKPLETDPAVDSLDTYSHWEDCLFTYEGSDYVQGFLKD